MTRRTTGRRVLLVAVVVLLAAALSLAVWVAQSPSPRARQLRLLLDDPPENVAVAYLEPEGIGYFAVPGSLDPQLSDAETESFSEPWSPPQVTYEGSVTATNPVTTALRAVRQYDRYLATGEPAVRAHVLSAADWMLEQQLPDGSWRYRFPYYGLEEGWTSGMAQGLALSLFARAYVETEDPAYLEGAAAAYAFLNTPVEAGGPLGTFDDGVAVFEEYPGQESTAVHVLNGALFAVFGVRDYAIAADDTEVWERFQEMGDGMYDHLEEYDRGWWTRYALSPAFDLASPAYHRLHIKQLDALAVYTGEQKWADVAERWREYIRANRHRVIWAEIVSEFE